MEELEKFYFQVIASLKNLESKRLLYERSLPVEYPVYEKRKSTYRARKLAKKQKKMLLKIEKGYYKGISDSIDKINKIYKDYIKCCSKD